MKTRNLASHLLAMHWEACTADCVSSPSNPESLTLNCQKGGPAQ